MIVDSIIMSNAEKLKEGIMLPLMEEFYTIQGEGFHTGKPAYFVRIGGCDVGCHWCDVKESWDATLHPLSSVDAIVANASKCLCKAVVVTGGEPCMYNLTYLTVKLKEQGIQTYLETSGAYTITGHWDWICVSPKKNMQVLAANFKKANELKVIIHNLDDLKFAELNAAQLKLEIGESKKVIQYLQPEWSKRDTVLPVIVDYCMKNPSWMVSLQTHKYIGIP